MAWLQDAWYWLHHAKDGWLAVQFVSQEGEVVTLKTAENEHYELAASTALRPALASSLRPSANLLELEELHEGAILNTLRMRYAQDEVYTYISSIVISINPYKQLSCYGPSQIDLYRHTLARRNAERARQSSDAAPPTEEEPLPPHIYALADEAFTSLLRDQENQAILISGESGAGKTECTKLCLQYLAEVGGQEATIAQQILEANPILEAFGNSKTVRNNNSSRFGKWMEIHFDASAVNSARICGARNVAYLLEKSRVVNQSAGERNFHSFYALCAGASEEERARLHLPAEGASAFRLLTGGGCLTVDGQNDVTDYADMRNAMRVLNFDSGESETILSVLAAILHVGNIEFELDKEGVAPTGATDERYRVANAPKSIDLACELLSLDPAVCTRAIVTRQLRIAGGEAITVFNSLTACGDNRDALAKALYESLFNFLISRINATLAAHTTQQPRIIGVLDIFGFEDFSETGNFLEQMMINYANEKLNEHFIEHVFRLEAKTYESEGIDVSAIAFEDHSMCLALIEERRTGIIDMIAEEIRLPRGSDENLLQRMHDAFAPASSATISGRLLPMGAYYIKPKTREAVFGIRHYAGDVTYRVSAFMEKSKDALADALVACIESSTEPLVARLLEKQAATSSPNATLRSPSTVTSPSSASSTPTAITAPMVQIPTRSASASFSIGSGSFGGLSSPSRISIGKMGSSAAPSSLTLGARFRAQLGDLLATLSSCRANFIRCLKPNELKIADNLDGAFVARQLHYLGIRDVISVRRQGFPVRFRYADFLERYRLLLQQEEANDQPPPPPPPSSEGEEDADPFAAAKVTVSQLFSVAALGIDAKDWRLGRTQVFVRNAVQTRLESARDARIVRGAVRLQALWRARVARKQYNAMRAAATRLAACTADALTACACTERATDASVLLVELDASVATAVAVDLPIALINEARRLRQRVAETSAARRALEAALRSKDAQLLRAAIERARGIALPETTAELLAADGLLARLAAYQASLAAAVEARDLQLLESALHEASALGLDSPAERDAAALLARLQLEARLEARLDSLILARGPLSDLRDAVAETEAAGIAPSKKQDSALYRAVALVNLLAREEAVIATLTEACSARSLAAIDACLHELLDDESLVSIHTAPQVVSAQALRSELQALAVASERAANLRASFGGRNIAYIESTLAALRALGEETLTQTLGEEGAALQVEAEGVLARLRMRLRVVARLVQALEERSEESLAGALDEARTHDASDAAEFAVAEKLLAALRAASAALADAACSDHLATIETALGDATKLGLSGPAVDAAHARRAHLLKLAEVSRLLTSAVQAQDEGMLALALDRARQAGLPEDDPKLAPALEAVAQIKAAQAAAAAAAQAELDRMAQAREQQRAIEEEEAAAAAAAVAALAEETARAAASGSAAPRAGAPGRVFHADTYRARHFALALYPNLRSPDDFSKGKLFGRGGLKATMLSWSKDPIPRSLLKFPATPAGEEVNAEALALFRTVQGFMGDRVYSFPDSLGCEVLSKALLQPQLRDEVFLQLAKQVSANSAVESVRKGWQLFALAAETFPPSAGLKPFLYNFLLGLADDTAYHARTYVSFCLRTLQQDLPAKATPPSIEHVTAFRERVMASADVRVYFPDGTALSLNIDATMSCNACVRNIADHIGLTRAHTGFGIYHLTRNQEPTFVAPTECLLDYPAAKCVAEQGTDEPQHRFIFQKRVWLANLADDFVDFASTATSTAAAIASPATPASAPSLDAVVLDQLSPADRLTCGIMYFQLVQDIFQLDHYDVTREELVRIQAAHLRVVETNVFGKIGDIDGLFASIQSQQPSVPSSYTPADAATFHSDALALASTLVSPASYSPLTLLRSFASRPHLGFQAFLVANGEIKVLPPLLWLGVTLHGLFLVDHASKRVLKAFKFAHLAGWAANAVRFSVRVLIGKAKTQQLNFDTKQGKRIAATLQEFVDVILTQHAQAQAKLEAAATAQPPPPPYPYPGE